MTNQLNFKAALAGLDFIANGKFKIEDPSDRRVYTLRLIERLLDQLESQTREATDSEDYYLRRALAYCKGGRYELAVDAAFRAVAAGDAPIFHGGLDLQEPRTQTLRQFLQSAREQLVPAPCPKCQERERIDAERQGGTAFVRCLACGHIGPEQLRRDGVSEHELLLAAVGAWNNLAR